MLLFDYYVFDHRITAYFVGYDAVAERRGFDVEVIFAKVHHLEID